MAVGPVRRTLSGGPLVIQSAPRSHVGKFLSNYCNGRRFREFLRFFFTRSSRALTEEKIEN